MAITSNDTELMRSSASVFATNSTAFTEESGGIKTTLSAISTALEKVVKDFNTHNGNVADYASAVSQATEQMQGIWVSGAATAFEESFIKFNDAMMKLSQMLQDIAGDFSNIKTQIEEIVNDNVLTQVETYANECLINSENLTKYANAEDENQANFAAAYGQ